MSQRGPSVANPKFAIAWATLRNFKSTALVLNHFIEELSLPRRSAPQSQSQDLEGNHLAPSGKRHHVADPDRRARFFDSLAVEPYMSLDGLVLRQTACLAEARMPQPFVDAKRFAQRSVPDDQPGKA